MLERRTIPAKPSIRAEREFSRRCGNVIVAGVDEAGRGPLAGPVVAGAVILPFDGPRPVGLNDSKKLSAQQRERLFRQICRKAVAWSIGIATAQEIDLLNILEATRLAVQRALDGLAVPPAALVTDALELPKDPRPQLALIKGDAISSSVAAASILAKVTRDRIMDEYAQEFPEYDWASNRGYPTSDHFAALELHGPTIVHRLTFQGVSFFSSHPRRSPTYLKLCAFIEELEAGGGGGDLSSLRVELNALRDRLPPPDWQELEKRLSQFPTEFVSS